MAQCTAQSKQHKRQCLSPAMRGRTTCQMHGGKTATLGAANRHFKTGRYSTVLPVRLAAQYQASLDNPALLSVRDDLAVCDARLAELFARLDRGESGDVWSRLCKTFSTFDAAMARRDLASMQASLETLRGLLTQGASDEAAWREVREMWASRCRLADTEQRTLVAQQQMVTIEQLGVFLGVVTDAIQRRVTSHADADTARAILGDLTADLARLSVREAGPGLGPHADA